MANIGPSKRMVKELVKKKKSWDGNDNDEDDNDDLEGHLDTDIEDEKKGIKTYSKRAKQHPMKKSIFSKIRKDEKKHKGILSRMMK